MQGSSGHGDQLTRPNHNFPILKLDDQLAIDGDEGLVRIRVPVPAELLRHHAHSDFMVIDPRE